MNDAEKAKHALRMDIDRLEQSRKCMYEAGIKARQSCPHNVSAPTAEAAIRNALDALAVAESQCEAAIKAKTHAIATIIEREDE